MSTLYASLSDYLVKRAREHGHSTTSLSRALVYGTSYISAVIRGQFLPSQRRCWQIAEFFGDDPNIILGLAGYYKPPPDTELTIALANVADELPERMKRILLGYATFLKEHQPSPAVGESRAHYLDVLYIELHSESRELKLPPDVATKVARFSLDEIADIIIAALRAIPEPSEE